MERANWPSVLYFIAGCLAAGITVLLFAPHPVLGGVARQHNSRTEVLRLRRENSKLKAERDHLLVTLPTGLRENKEGFETLHAYLEHRQWLDAENEKRRWTEHEAELARLAAERERVGERGRYLETRMDALKAALKSILDGALREPGFRERFPGIPREAYPWPGTRFGDVQVCVLKRTFMQNGQLQSVYDGYRIPLAFDSLGAVQEVGRPARNDNITCGTTFGFFTFQH